MASQEAAIASRCQAIRTRSERGQWELYDQHGHPVGRDVEFWLLAERELNENE
jgi:hypothetical protein